MYFRYKVCILAIASVAFSIACQREKVHDGKAALTLTIEPDRKEYDQDDTIMVVAVFRGDAHIQLQILGPHFSPMSFHTFWKRLPEKDGGQPPPINYVPAWELQLVQRRDHLPDQQPILIHTESEYAHQLALHFQEGSRLPAGRYQLWVGYSIDREKMQDLAKTEMGSKDTIQGAGAAGPHAFKDAVLSKPVTITIRPTKSDK